MRDRISGPLRQAIKASGVSMYELARQVGIAESVLSRFLGGKQGITLATADRLADVLGVGLVARVARVEPPRKRRSSRAQARRVISLDGERARRAELTTLASGLARSAHERFFASQLGVWKVERDFACIYSNRGADQWNRLLPELQRRLKAEKFRVVATAAYPENAYTNTMILSLPPKRNSGDVADLYERAVLATMAAQT